jgi:recombination protein RecA
MAKTIAAAVLQSQFESVLGGHLDWQSRPVPELVRTGVSEVDTATGGLPRGSLTEIIGPASSGRTSLLVAILAEATARDEVCALVDAEDSFDPSSAARAGVRLERLIWVRSAHNAEHALKAADLLIQGGGFGLVAMDLGDTPPETARRISLTSWFRLRRAVENTPTVLVTLARQSNAKTCASLILECKRERAAWSGTPRRVREIHGGSEVGLRPPGSLPHGYLLRGIAVRVTSKNRSKVCSPVFTAVAI